MLYNNAVMSSLGQGYWERWRVGGTHTRDTGEKEKNLSLHSCCEFQPGFCSQSCGQIIWLKFNWGQSVAWLIYGIFYPTWHSLCLPLQSMTPNSHQRVRIWTMWRMVPVLLPDIFPRPNISPASAPLPNLQSTCWKEKKSYPMYVSGHGMVEWV